MVLSTFTSLYNHHHRVILVTYKVDYLTPVLKVL